MKFLFYIIRVLLFVPIVTIALFATRYVLGDDANTLVVDVVAFVVTMVSIFGLLISLEIKDLDDYSRQR